MFRIFKLNSICAYDQAALHLMREALEDWKISIYQGDLEYEIILSNPASGAYVEAFDENLARAILIAVLRACLEKERAAA